MSVRSPRKPAVGFIFITLFLSMLGVGIIIPIVPRLVTRFEGGSIAEGSDYYGWLVCIFAAAQFVAAPILGALSDRFGRRKVILVALSGSAIDYVLLGFAPSLGWLFAARVISGLTAGSLATCNAYIADVTPPEKRASAYGLIGAAIGLGFVVGPAVGGFFGSIRLQLPFFVAAGFVAANWIYGAFVLPESLPPENRRPFSWRRANPMGSLLALRRFRGVFDLACVHFIFTFAAATLQCVWVLYTDYRFGWSPFDVGLSLTFVGILTAVVSGGFVKRVVGRIGERRGLVAGLVISAVAMAGYGLSSQGWMMYATIFVGAWGGLVGPSAQSLITRHVPRDEQGSVQGALSGLQSLAYIFAPLLASRSFAWGISDAHGWRLPGIAFFEAFALMLVALALAFRSFQLDDRVAARAAVERGRPAVS